MNPREEAAGRDLLLRLFEAAVKSADAAAVLPDHLPESPRGRVLVVGAGKASAAMARAVELSWPGPLTGLVVTRYGHGAPCERIEVVEAGHPAPDNAGVDAAARILRLVSDLTADDLVICLMSGGGSSLLSLPAEGIGLEDKRWVTRSLLRCGATIAEINCVRKHLSAIKGGQLAAAAHPACVVTYLVSDVPGDDPSVVASGPTVPDPTTFADALAVLASREVDAPPAVAARLLAGARLGPPGDPCRGVPAETPKPGDAGFDADRVIMLVTAADSLRAAAVVALAAGVTPVILGDALEGEARELAAQHARLARACAAGRGLVRLPCVLLSGGETTVTVRGGGRGGRNAEYLLALALELDGCAGVSALAADTDGIDGTEDNAGAVVTPDTLARAHRLGLVATAMRDDNDAYTFFEGLSDLIVTGPTRTNVNDFRAILVEPTRLRKRDDHDAG